MNSKIVIIVTLIIATSRFLFIPLPITQTIYYAWFGFIAILAFLNLHKFDIKTVALIVACSVSLLANNVPDIFQPWYRLLSFTIMISAIGPLIISESVDKFKQKLLKIQSYIILFAVVISFVGYTLRIPVFFNNTGFCGLTYHSMTLSSLGGISMIIATSMYFQYKESSDNNKHKSKKRLLLVTFIIMSLIVCFLGGSRSALLSSLVGFLFFIWIQFGKKIDKFIKYFMVISLCTVLTYPVWYTYTEAIRIKVENNEKRGGQFASRESLWDNRISEFESSPIFGIGFSSIDLNKPGNTVMSNGGIEPGSSWLFMLSSIGILGLFSFLFIVLPPIFTVLKSQKKIPSAFLLVTSILVARLIHMFAEGYILSSGDFSFYYIWLVIAVANIMNRNFKNGVYETENDNKSIKEIA